MAGTVKSSLDRKEGQPSCCCVEENEPPFCSVEDNALPSCCRVEPRPPSCCCVEPRPPSCSRVEPKPPSCFSMDVAASEPTLVITVRDCKDDVKNRTEAEFMNIQLRFLAIILSVLLTQEVYVYNVYITNQFHTTSAGGWGGGAVNSVSRGDCD